MKIFVCQKSHFSAFTFVRNDRQFYMTPVLLHVKFIGNKLSVTDPDLAQNGFQFADFWVFCCTNKVAPEYSSSTMQQKLRMQACPWRVRFIRFTSTSRIVGSRKAIFLCIPRFMCFFFMARRYSTLCAPFRLALLCQRDHDWESPQSAQFQVPCWPYGSCRFLCGFPVSEYRRDGFLVGSRRRLNCSVVRRRRPQSKATGEPNHPL